MDFIIRSFRASEALPGFQSFLDAFPSKKPYKEYFEKSLERGID